MLIKVIIFALGFAVGFICARELQKEEARNRRKRRQRIINKKLSWKLLDQRCRRERKFEKSARKKEGFRIFKGGMNKMTEAQFQTARRLVTKQMNDELSDNNYRQIVDTAHQLLGRQADVTVVDEFKP